MAATIEDVLRTVNQVAPVPNEQWMAATHVLTTTLADSDVKAQRQATLDDVRGACLAAGDTGYFVAYRDNALEITWLDSLRGGLLIQRTQSDSDSRHVIGDITTSLVYRHPLGTLQVEGITERQIDDVRPLHDLLIRLASK
jgi:hypothetical protein